MSDEPDDIQTPLVTDRLPERIDSPADVLTPIPEGFVVRQEPSRETKAMLDEIGSRTLCGSPFEFVWKQGPYKGDAVRMYCAEPFCIETGACTGARFVPSDPQFTSHDTEDPLRRRREMSAEEVIAAARWSAKKATGKDDPRSDRDIARFAGGVLQRARAALRGSGDWGL
jgi:hypothetical protein